VKKETIGERLRRLRVERGLSQRQLSTDRAGYAYISRIEAGTRNPSVKVLRELADKLGVNAHYLETGEQDLEWVLEPISEILLGVVARAAVAHEKENAWPEYGDAFQESLRRFKELV
jgi:transcriptional regulator with XRE-family HTH domain